MKFGETAILFIRSYNNHKRRCVQRLTERMAGLNDLHNLPVCNDKEVSGALVSAGRRGKSGVQDKRHLRITERRLIIIAIRVDGGAFIKEIGGFDVTLRKCRNEEQSKDCCKGKSKIPFHGVTFLSFKSPLAHFSMVTRLAFHRLQMSRFW